MKRTFKILLRAVNTWSLDRYFSARIERITDTVLTYVLFIPLIARMEERTYAHRVPLSSVPEPQRYVCIECGDRLVLCRVRECRKCGAEMKVWAS